MEKILRESIDSCDAFNAGKMPTRETACIYPFATENIGGYIDCFNLKDRSLLTVGSSGDQAINAALRGCKDITILDMVPDTRYYYYLKIAGLLSLSKDEFLNFFRYRWFSEDNNNINAFNNEIYKKLRDTLRVLDKDSFDYFDTLFSLFTGLVVRVSIFQSDEEPFNVIERINPYLSSNISYDETKEKIKKVEPKFLCQNVFDMNVSETYDNIWLSNIATWQTEMDDVIKLFDESYPLLNDGGKLLLSYLYSFGLNTRFDPEREPIYDIKQVKKTFSDYNIEQKEFDGATSSYRKNIKDSVLILTKK